MIFKWPFAGTALTLLSSLQKLPLAQDTFLLPRLFAGFAAQTRNQLSKERFSPKTAIPGTILAQEPPSLRNVYHQVNGISTNV